jgi:hypothetical protein
MHKFCTIALSALFCACAIPACAIPAFAQAAAPAAPACASGDPVVWENSSSKVYHMQGDSYYGKTKKGAYACKSTADAAGYHASGSKSGTKTPASPSAMASAAPSPMASAKSRHHRKASTASPEPGGSSASPNARSFPTPAST